MTDPQCLAIMAAILYAKAIRPTVGRPGLDERPDFYGHADAVDDARLLMMAANDLHDRDTTAAPQEGAQT